MAESCGDGGGAPNRRPFAGSWPHGCGESAAGGGEEFGAEHAGHAGDDRCIAVRAEPVFDERVDLGQLAVQVEETAASSAMSAAATASPRMRPVADVDVGEVKFPDGSGAGRVG